MANQLWLAAEGWRKKRVLGSSFPHAARMRTELLWLSASFVCVCNFKNSILRECDILALAN